MSGVEGGQDRLSVDRRHHGAAEAGAQQIRQMLRINKCLRISPFLRLLADELLVLLCFLSVTDHALLYTKMKAGILYSSLEIKLFGIVLYAKRSYYGAMRAYNPHAGPVSCA